MKFQSTRSNELVQPSFAILNGLASDGGLYVPQSIPTINLDKLVTKNYQAIALEVLSLYFSEFSSSELQEAIELAYNKFSIDEVIKVQKFEKRGYLELFHGETAAFKDMALSLFPHLLVLARKYQKEQRDIFILTATSGDTGKAAMEAIKDVEHVEISVIYPSTGVSSIQKEQMQKQQGSNVHVIGIEGNFDDAQSSIKQIFSDEVFLQELKDHNYLLSSANSINIARLIPQIIYYIASYFELANKGVIKLHDKIDVSVPSGNFGNILAAYLAKEMGLPIDMLICASNENNILTDFIKTGVYDTRRDFKKTYSPSMDILISSNLERFLYFGLNQNTILIKQIMNDLKTKKHFKLSDEQSEKIRENIVGYWVSNQTSIHAIKEEYQINNYLIDPHTAIAKEADDLFIKDYQSENYQLIVATASPYKFIEAVGEALEIEASIAAILAKTNVEVPINILGLAKHSVRFQNQIKNTELNKYLFNSIRKRR